MYYLLYSLNALIMIAAPLLLGWLIARRRQASWSLFAIGAVTFILSQIGHVPFNYWVDRVTKDSLAQLSPMASLFITTAFLGISSGIFEEGARYLTFRYWAKNARSWGTGLMLGAGHGGGEAIILGLVTAVNFTFYFSFRGGNLTDLIPAGQEAQVQQLLTVLFSAAWYETLLGAVERIFALTAHLTLSLLVMQAVALGRLRWLALAVSWHALFNALAILALSFWGKYVAEGLLGLMAVLSLLYVIRSKRPEPAEPELEPLPEVGPIGPVKPILTSDQLDRSRYV